MNAWHRSLPSYERRRTTSARPWAGAARTQAAEKNCRRIVTSGLTTCRLPTAGWHQNSSDVSLAKPPGAATCLLANRYTDRANCQHRQGRKNAITTIERQDSLDRNARQATPHPDRATHGAYQGNGTRPNTGVTRPVTTVPFAAVLRLAVVNYFENSSDGSDREGKRRSITSKRTSSFGERAWQKLLLPAGRSIGLFFSAMPTHSSSVFRDALSLVFAQVCSGGIKGSSITNSAPPCAWLRAYSLPACCSMMP